MSEREEPTVCHRLCVPVLSHYNEKITTGLMLQFQHVQLQSQGAVPWLKSTQIEVFVFSSSPAPAESGQESLTVDCGFWIRQPAFFPSDQSAFPFSLFHSQQPDNKVDLSLCCAALETVPFHRTEESIRVDHVVSVAGMCPSRSALSLALQPTWEKLPGTLPVALPSMICFVGLVSLHITLHIPNCVAFTIGKGSVRISHNQAIIPLDNVLERALNASQAPTALHKMSQSKNPISFHFPQQSSRIHAGAEEYVVSELGLYFPVRESDVYADDGVFLMHQLNTPPASYKSLVSVLSRLFAAVYSDLKVTPPTTAELSYCTCFRHFECVFCFLSQHTASKVASIRLFSMFACTLLQNYALIHCSCGVCEVDVDHVTIMNTSMSVQFEAAFTHFEILHPWCSPVRVIETEQENTVESQLDNKRVISQHVTSLANVRLLAQAVMMSSKKLAKTGFMSLEQITTQSADASTWLTKYCDQHNQIECSLLSAMFMGRRSLQHTRVGREVSPTPRKQQASLIGAIRLYMVKLKAQSFGQVLSELVSLYPYDVPTVSKLQEVCDVQRTEPQLAKLSKLHTTKEKIFLPVHQFIVNTPVSMATVLYDHDHTDTQPILRRTSSEPLFDSPLRSPKTLTPLLYEARSSPYQHSQTQSYSHSLSPFASSTQTSPALSGSFNSRPAFPPALAQPQQQQQQVFQQEPNITHTQPSIMARQGELVESSNRTLERRASRLKQPKPLFNKDPPKPQHVSSMLNQAFDVELVPQRQKPRTGLSSSSTLVVTKQKSLRRSQVALEATEKQDKKRKTVICRQRAPQPQTQLFYQTETTETNVAEHTNTIFADVIHEKLEEQVNISTEQPNIIDSPVPLLKPNRVLAERTPDHEQPPITTQSLVNPYNLLRNRISMVTTEQTAPLRSKKTLEERLRPVEDNTDPYAIPDDF